MPDLATHVTVAWIAGRAAGRAADIPSRAMALLIVGSTLPDLLARAPHLVLRSADVRSLTQGLHTPACLLAACLFLSFLFEEKGRGKTFLMLLAGAALHCLVDFLQIAWPGSQYWLYPITRWSPQGELIPGDLTVLYLPFLLIPALALEVLHWRRRRPPSPGGDPVPASGAQ